MARLQAIEDGFLGEAKELKDTGSIKRLSGVWIAAMSELLATTQSWMWKR